MMRRFQYIVLLIAMAAMMAGWQCAIAQNSAAESPTGFPPLDQWQSAILAGDAMALKALYSVDPVVQVDANGTKSGADADINFWLGLKARDMKLEIVRLTQGTGKRGVIFKAEVQTGAPNRQSMRVTTAQGWQKQGDFRGQLVLRLPRAGLGVSAS
jgi:hypothetical protein